MKKIYKFLILLILVLNFNMLNLLADTPHVIDFKKILNESEAGKEAQKILKKKLTQTFDKFKKDEDQLKKDENDLINKKKVISGEEFKKEVTKIRSRVAKLQKDKKISYDSIGKMRNDSKEKLLKLLNPLIKNYMKDNNIRIILDKSSVIAGDQNLDITSKIIAILNKEVKSLGIK
jgi:outer membrane protein